jgi:GT2 family glycosyltransferase
MAMVIGPQSASVKPLCSVCISNFNGERIIEVALQSVYEQDCEFPLEILVHDDASTDDSVGVIRRNHPLVKLITSDRNVGYCISNNRMAAQARGDYVLLLNNDAALFPNALSALHRQALQDTAPLILGLPQFESGSGAFIDSGNLLDPFMNPVPNLDTTRQQVAMVIGACLWMPKRLWMQLNGFPDFFGSNAEDMHLCCSARLRGFEVKVASGSGFYHQVGGSLGGGKVINRKLVTTSRRRSLSERNKNYVLAIVSPAPWFFFILPLHLLLLSIEGVLLAAIKKDHRIWDDIYFKSLSSLIQNRKVLARHRRDLQKTRQVTMTQYFSQFVFFPHKLRMLLKYGLPQIR